MRIFFSFLAFTSVAVDSVHFTEELCLSYSFIHLISLLLCYTSFIHGDCCFVPCFITRINILDPQQQEQQKMTTQNATLFIFLFSFFPLSFIENYIFIYIISRRNNIYLLYKNFVFFLYSSVGSRY